MPTTPTPARLVRCRYRRRNDLMCDNPALDQADDAEVYLCVSHVAKAMRLVQEHQAQALAAVKAG